VPVVADALESVIEFGIDGITFPHHPEKDEQGDQADEHVQSMKPSQGKERGRKLVGAEVNPFLEEFPIFFCLAAEKNCAEHNS